MPPHQRPNAFIFDERSLFPLQRALAAARIARNQLQREYEESQREVIRLRLALKKAEKAVRAQEC